MIAKSKARVEELKAGVAVLEEEHEARVAELKAQVLAEFKEGFKAGVAELEKQLEARGAKLKARFVAETRAEVLAALNAEETALDAEDAALKAKREMARMESVSSNDGVYERGRDGNGEDESGLLTERSNKRMKLSDGTPLPLPTTSGGSDESNSLQDGWSTSKGE